MNGIVGMASPSRGIRWSDSVLRILRDLDNFSQSPLKHPWIPLVVCEKHVGMLLGSLLDHLVFFPEVFRFVRNEDGKTERVEVCRSLDTYDARSEAINKVVVKLAEEGTFETLKGWRYEV